MVSCKDCGNDVVFKVKLENVYGVINRKSTPDGLELGLNSLYFRDVNIGLGDLVCTRCGDRTPEDILIACEYTGGEGKPSDFKVLSIDKGARGTKKIIVLEDGVDRIKEDYERDGYECTVGDAEINVVKEV